MRIAIIGIGKMGSLIRELAAIQGHDIAAEIGSENKADIERLGGKSIDVAIEFTEPGSAVDNFMSLAKQGISTVTGTTGWYSNLPAVSSAFNQTNTGFFYASNFSIGVHISIATSNFLAKLMSSFDNYSLKLEEWHHTEKKDAPSGTAITIAENIIENHSGYESFASKDDQKKSVFLVTSFREGNIKGTHKITYSSQVDTISLEHAAQNREGFASGALQAAAFLKQNDPGIYTMKDLIQLNS